MKRGRGGDREREREKERDTQIHAGTRHVIGQERFQMTGEGWFFLLVFLIQSQVLFIKVEMIAVQWSDWFHVRRR